MALEAGDSGRVGAMIEIVRSLKIAVDAGKKDNFFDQLDLTKEEIIEFGQKHAIAKENLLKIKSVCGSDNDAI